MVPVVLLWLALLPGLAAALLLGRLPPRTVTLALHRAPRRSKPGSGLAALQQRSGPVAGVGLGLRERGHVYQGTLALGSEGREFAVVFDTGSANLVVPAASCTSIGCRGASRRFDPAGSSSGGYVTASGQKTDYEGAWRLSLGYASGKVSGEAFEDRACLGSACASRVRFVLAEYESDDFADFHFDGILGLAPRGQLSAGESFSLVDQLVKQGVLSERIFAFALSRDGPSEVTFGGYDSARAGDSLRWLDADLRRGAWEVPLQDFRLGGQAQALCAERPCKAVIDSGCSSIGLPGGLAGQLAERLNFTGGARQCSDLASLPTLGLVLGGAVFELEPEDYVQVAADESGCHLRWSDMAGASRGDPVVLGHPFLQRFYSVFDEDHRRIGLAAAARPAAASADGGEGTAAAAMRKMLSEARAGR